MLTWKTLILFICLLLHVLQKVIHHRFPACHYNFTSLIVYHGIAANIIILQNLNPMQTEEKQNALTSLITNSKSSYFKPECAL